MLALNKKGMNKVPGFRSEIESLFKQKTNYEMIRMLHVDFIEFLESKRKRLSRVKEDPLSKTIGICEGPSDLAEKHNKYVYG